MIASLAHFIDWYILQWWWALRLLGKPSRLNLIPETSELEGAIQFLNSPNFIPTESRPAQLEFDGATSFKFPTAEPSDFPENNTVYGHLYRCQERGIHAASTHALQPVQKSSSPLAIPPLKRPEGRVPKSERWHEHPTIILLHGGGDFFNYRYRFPWIARAFNRAGFNVATLAAPYHFQRRLRPFPEWNHFRTAKAFSQAVADIRALTGWLLEQGSPSVALWGFSLGGWHAGLAACHDSRFGAVVLSAPGVRFDYKFAKAEHVMWRRVREFLGSQIAAGQALDQTPLNLTRLRPRLPKESILLLEGKYDLFVEPRTVEDLWQSWQQPEIRRLPYGHVTWMLAPSLTRHVLQWLSSRLH